MSIYFYGCVSIDGYLADQDHGLAWLHQTGSPEETNYAAFYAKMDVTIMGKRTFDEMADLPDLSSIYSGTKNYVFTHQKTLSATDFIPVAGDIVDFVRTLPPQQNVWLIGGNTLLGPLLDADLIDCLYIQYAPVLLGAGVPLFTQKAGLKRFELQEVNRYGQFSELVFSKRP